MPSTTAKQVILDILRAGDGEWSGKVKLHKAFYFAHLYYANEHPGFLTDWPIAKLQHGPGIHEDESLIWGMVDEGLLEVELVHEGPYPEYRYRLTAKGRQEGSDIPNDAHLAIEKAAPKNPAAVSHSATKANDLPIDRRIGGIAFLSLLSLRYPRR